MKNLIEKWIILLFIPALFLNFTPEVPFESIRYQEPFYPVLFGRAEMPKKPIYQIRKQSKRDLTECDLAVLKQAILNDHDPELMLAITEIENTEGIPTAKNKESTASGCNQILRKTWNDYCLHIDTFENGRFDADKNAMCAAELLKPENGGINHWLADSRTAEKLRARGFVE